MSGTERFLQYGVSNDLAAKAAAAGLTVSQVRFTTQKNLREKYNLTAEEAKFLTSAVKRQPIDENLV